ncbi:MAG: hypothetical protein ACP5MZ_01705 [Candidatus Micrarchaeia archaeon]
MAERLITINIRRYLAMQPRTKRVKRAARYVRERAAHYMKMDEGDVLISKELNNRIVKYYSRKMVPIKLSAKIDNGKAVLNEFSVEKPAAEQKPANKAAAGKKQGSKAAPAKGAAVAAQKPKPASQEKKG